MKIAVLGAGAIGSLFASLLTEDGAEVILLTRTEEQAEYISENGVKVTDREGSRIVKIPTRSSRSFSGAADLILIAVKSYDTRTAVKNIADQLGEDTCVLTLQNGLGNIEMLVDILGRERVLAGTTAQASTLIKIGNILHAADGPTVIGELHGGLSKRATAISSLFNSCGISTKLTDNLYGAVWMKVLVNAGINPLSALMGLTNGELIELPEVREVMVQAVREGEAVSRRLRIGLGGLDPVEKMLQTARKTYRNRSSMLQDVLRGKRTEVDSINGTLVDIGRRLGVYTPVNEWLTRSVKDIPMIGSSDRGFHREILVRPLQSSR